MNIHQHPDFVEWFLKPMKCAPHVDHSSRELFVMSRVYMSIQIRKSMDDQVSAIIADLESSKQERTPEEIADYVQFFKNAYCLYSQDIERYLPRRVSFVENSNVELWQEGDKRNWQRHYIEGKPTIVDYILRVTNLEHVSKPHRAALTKVIKRILEDNQFSLISALEKPGARFYNIPSKILTELCTTVENEYDSYSLADVV